MAKIKTTKSSIKKKAGNPQNLIPVTERTKSEAKEISRNGGIASGKARREKKLLSQIYGEFLADEYNEVIDGKKKAITGTKLVKVIALDVLNRRDSASVSMLKEIREATEGNNINISGDLDIYEMSTEQREQRRKEIAEKRKRLGLD